MFKEIREDHRRKDDKGVLPPEALNLIRLAGDMNWSRQSDQFRNDVQATMNDLFLKWPWLYIQAGIIIVTAVFAVIGIIRLQSVSINVREEADNALRAARASIEEHRMNVEGLIETIGKQAQLKVDEAKQDIERKMDDQLRSSLDEARGRINSGAANHLETIKREKTPDLERGLMTAQAQVTEIDRRLQGVQAHLTTLESSSEQLGHAIKSIDAATGAGTLDQASLFLNRSRRWVLAELVINSIATIVLIIASVAAIIRLTKRIILK